MRPHASDLGNNLVLDGAELVDLAADDIPHREQSRWLESKADAARRAGEDQVAGLQRHGPRDIRDLGHIEPDASNLISDRHDETQVLSPALPRG
jgi:hypothetical protein